MKHPQKFKLLALDIDGTLVPEHTNHLSPKLIEAIQSVKDFITVAIVSARARKDQQIIIDSLGLTNGYHVTENGTRMIRPDGSLEYTLYLPHAEVTAIQQLTEALCDSIGYCVEGNWLTNNPEDLTDCVTTLSLIPHKINIDQITGLLSPFMSTLAITIANHWNNPDLGVVLISHKDASKGGGLRSLQKMLGITPEETIAVGDGVSDVPMMEYAAVKVAMGNAEEALKKVATHVVGTVDDDGVVEVIQRFILNQSNKEKE